MYQRRKMSHMMKNFYCDVSVVLVQGVDVITSQTRERFVFWRNGNHLENHDREAVRYSAEAGAMFRGSASLSVIPSLPTRSSLVALRCRRDKSSRRIRSFRRARYYLGGTYGSHRLNIRTQLSFCRIL